MCLMSRDQLSVPNFAKLKAAEDEEDDVDVNEQDVIDELNDATCFLPAGDMLFDTIISKTY